MTINPVLPVYNIFDREFVRGEGVYLYGADGKDYLDFACGYGVTGLGHCHPKLVAALKEQAETLWHVSNMFHLKSKERLAARLVEHSFADSIFFTNSGAEAWELGLKMIRRYFDRVGQSNKYRLICIDGAFHGRTMGAISAAPRDYMVDGFGPLLDGFDIVPFEDLAALKSAITPETAAIHLEPVMGEGGIKPHSPEYLKAVKKLCEQHDLLLFFDEVQCGMGRTGKLFAHEWAGVTPDVLCTAKGIGGGFPLGACLATERVAQYMTAGSHGTTYGGNPLAMAVGNAVADVMFEAGFFDTVVQRGQYLRGKLQQLLQGFPNLYTEVRGEGLMLGLKCADNINNRTLIEVMHAEGVISIPSGENTVRILPPLIISEDEIDLGIARVRAASEKFARSGI